MRHPISSQAYAKARQQDVLRAAEHHRMVRQARAGNPGLTARLLERLGGFLIKIGGRLQERQAPQSTGTLGLAEK